MIAAICLFFVSTAALVYLHKTSTVPPIATDYAEQQISQVISDKAGAKPLSAPANPSDLNGNIYSPEDTFVFQKLDFGAPAKLRGVLASLTFSKSRAHLYFNFSHPESSQPRGVIHKSDFSGDYPDKDFELLIGKTITLDGVIYTDSPRRTRLLKIQGMRQIKVED
ncbi:MAG: hypothetical protein H7Y36_06340 [Armatimonadetes bacterium]|nr:hypothetical protein [Akkermansiaceae bacterium]